MNRRPDAPENGARNPAAPPLAPGRFVAGIAGGAVIALTGVWLIAAPFALGYQPEGADWADATVVGVAGGSGLVVAGIAVVALLVAALRRELASRGLVAVASTSTGPPQPTEGATTAPDAASRELDEVLVPLAAALLEDLRAGQGSARSRSENSVGGTGPDRERPDTRAPQA